jgi:hypothetical protein
MPCSQGRGWVQPGCRCLIVHPRSSNWQVDAPETQTTALRALQLVLTSIPADRAAEALEAAGVAPAAVADVGAMRLRQSGGAAAAQAGRRMVQVRSRMALYGVVLTEQGPLLYGWPCP